MDESKDRALCIIGGVDTHKDTHTAAALDGTGRLLGSATFAATAPGYAELLTWFRGFGRLDQIGVEGTGSYGAGLTSYLCQQRVTVIEVHRPNRQTRRRRGKSDTVDAEAAARATLAGDEKGLPKVRDGVVEAIRLLRLQRRSAIQARTQAANQLHAIVVTAPEPLRGSLRELPIRALVERVSKFSKLDAADAKTAAQRVLRGLARRWLQLEREVVELDRELKTLVDVAAPALVARKGVGVDVAGALLVAVGDNPDRLSSEASFAALCGVSPVDASSGRQHRHRLNRDGNRDANRALWVVALSRLRTDTRTRFYADRRTTEGLSKPEILRCIKRYIAREIFKILRAVQPAQSPPHFA